MVIDEAQQIYFNANSFCFSINNSTLSIAGQHLRYRNGNEKLVAQGFERFGEN